MDMKTAFLWSSTGEGMVDLFGQELRPTIIHCDNQSCIRLSENPVFHDRSKHIEIRYYFIRDYVHSGAVEL